MKTTTILLTFILVVFVTFFFSFKTPQKECKSIGEKIFEEHAEECLNKMKFIADKHAEKGVAVIAFIPGDKTESWISKMKVVGTLSNTNYNFLAVASSKAAEMSVTLEDSGTSDRKPLIGELGYKGGVIKKVKCGFIIASFSGAPAEIDAKISKHAIDFLSEYY